MEVVVIEEEEEEDDDDDHDEPTVLTRESLKVFFFFNRVDLNVLRALRYRPRIEKWVKLISVRREGDIPPRKITTTTTTTTKLKPHHMHCKELHSSRLFSTRAWTLQSNGHICCGASSCCCYCCSCCYCYCCCWTTQAHSSYYTKKKSSLSDRPAVLRVPSLLGESFNFIFLFSSRLYLLSLKVSPLILFFFSFPY